MEGTGSDAGRRRSGLGVKVYKPDSIEPQNPARSPVGAGQDQGFEIFSLVKKPVLKYIKNNFIIVPFEAINLRERKGFVLDNKGFDKWSGVYDEQILKMQDKGYPFEGYYDTLGYIQSTVKVGMAKKVLDIGIGSGLLTETLYGAGIEITGIDFSSRMLEAAKDKMPKGRFILFDFNEGLPQEIEEEIFDFIISSYAVHHIDDENKIELFREMTKYLSDKGMLLIGDVAFETRRDMETTRERSIGWDDAEHYIVAEEMIGKLAGHQLKSEFVKTSVCSGVLVVQAPAQASPG